MIDIDPTIDFACKMLLGDPAHSNLTIHFLNAVLRAESPIVSVEFLNPIVNQEFESDKLSILDILAQDDRGRRFNIEVQRTKPIWLPERLAFYTATQLVEQIGEGDSYSKLLPSIGICILDAKLFPAISEYHQQFRMRTRTGLELTNCMEIHTLVLPKYIIDDNNHLIVDPLDQWMNFFRTAFGSTREQLTTRLQDPIFAEAIGVLEMISRTPEQRRFYNARLKWELDENTRLEAAINEGRALGMALGKAEGKAEGKVEGLAEEKISQILLLEELLGEPTSDLNMLKNMDLESLDETLRRLQTQLRIRLN